MTISSAAPVLVVDNEPTTANLVIDYLEQACYATHWLSDGSEVVHWVRQNTPRLILLDIVLPSVDGMKICREIRAFSDVPIVMLTARVAEVDRLLGFDLGADDYICKPFSPREVVARVRAILRRVSATQPTQGGYLGVTLDEKQHRASINGQQLNLTPVEFRLLVIFLKCPGRVYSRTHLMDGIYADNFDVSDRSIDSHIKNLRKKIRKFLPNQKVIHTIYGIGYKFE
jgi:two-component system response regulator BaeR